MESTLADGGRIATCPGRTRIALRLLVLPLAFLFGVACHAGFGQALAVQPATIGAPSAGFTAQAYVVFRNSATQRLEHVSLTSFSNDGVTASIGKPAAFSILPRGEVDWPVQLTVPPSAHLPGSVLFRAAYTQAGLQHFSYISLAVQADGPKTLVDATLQGTPDPISQQRPAILYLVVTNNLDVPVTVAAMPQPTAGGLQIGAPCENPPCRIDPYTVPSNSVDAHPIALTTGFRVTPGTQQAAVDVDTQWTRDGQTDRRHFALTKAVTVGVFFESDLLKALSIPSFLLLPGCLAVFTFQSLMSLGWLKTKSQSTLAGLTLQMPMFWVISLTFSGILLSAYYLITGVNCLIAYGVADMGYMWGAGILFGIALFVLFAIFQHRWVRRHVVTGGDTALQVLDKLARNNLGILRPGIRFKLNGADCVGLVLEDADETQPAVWVSPAASVTWKDNSDQMQKDFNAIINSQQRDPKALARLLHQAGALAEVDFVGNADFPGPCYLKREAVTGPAAEQLFVG